MADTLERLRHRIDVYAKTESKTEFGELTYSYNKISTVWAEILPTSGRENNRNGGTVYESITHKITVRNGAVENPRNDMYFTFKNQKYKVMYYMPHYRRNDLIEFYCKLILEGDHDYD